ncbi:hypothetical protein [Acetobacter malorum]|uniref:hypothetical protein n=1 Tax=Acetobacter malorum TaxID=178901 RepID=UPI0009ECE063|nr:hypothetical protein [Acetobacter malorum]
MSRTHHHSGKFGKPRGLRVFPAGKDFRTPHWHTHLHIIRPGRRCDKVVARMIVKGEVGPEEAIFPYTGTKRPHDYLD